VGDQVVGEGDGITVQQLAGADVASTVVRGPMRDAASTFEAMVHWIESSGYQTAAAPSRELYHELHTDESRQVTELQLPISPA
jgi:effector-binding domain-containing protein